MPGVVQFVTGWNSVSHLPSVCLPGVKPGWSTGSSLPWSSAAKMTSLSSGVLS